MSFQLNLDGQDITNKVIQYSRNQNICSGVGTITFNTDLSISPSTWEEIILYEFGNKKGTFYVDSFNKDAKNGTLTIEGQDNSKRLEDYFIDDQNQEPFLTRTKYWIEKFLDEAGVNYQFDVSEEGPIVAENTVFGPDSTMNLIVTLLQQSGWFIYFDANGKAHIDDLQKGVGNYNHLIKENETLLVESRIDDTTLRNRAVVWGNADPTTGVWIFADKTIITPWNIDSDDERAVVVADPNIRTTATASGLVKRLLDLFAEPKKEITVEIPTDSTNYKISDIVRIKSNLDSGSYMLSSIESSGGSDGFRTTLILNEKCPRLFSFYHPPEIPSELVKVYIGTWGDGVWERDSNSATWVDFSTGLEDLYIKDLFIRNGVYACVADDGYFYYRNIDDVSWSKFNHGVLIDLLDEVWLESETKAVACSIGYDGSIVVGYILRDRGTDERSWVIRINPSTGQYFLIENLDVDGIVGYTIEDIEAGSNYNIVSTVGKINPDINIEFVNDYNESGGNLGSRDSQSSNLNQGVVNEGDYSGKNVGPDGDVTLNSYVSGSSAARSNYIIDSDQVFWYSTDTGLYALDPINDTSTFYSYSDDLDTRWSPGTLEGVVIEKAGSDTFYIMVIVDDSDFGADTTTLKLIPLTFTLSTETLSEGSASLLSGSWGDYAFADAPFMQAGGYAVAVVRDETTSPRSAIAWSKPMGGGSSSTTTFSTSGENWDLNQIDGGVVNDTAICYLYRTKLDSGIWSLYCDSCSVTNGTATPDNNVLVAQSGDTEPSASNILFMEFAGLGVADPSAGAFYTKTSLRADHSSDNKKTSIVLTILFPNVAKFADLRETLPDSEANTKFDNTARTIWDGSGGGQKDVFALFNNYGGVYFWGQYNETSSTVVKLHTIYDTSLDIINQFYNPIDDEEVLDIGSHISDYDNTFYAKRPGLVSTLWGYDLFTASQKQTITLPVNHQGGITLLNRFFCNDYMGDAKRVFNVSEDDLPDFDPGKQPLILKQSASYSTTPISPLIVETTSGDFTVIYEPDYTCKVEISRGVPVIAYSLPPSGEDFGQPSFLAFSFTTISGDFTVLEDKFVFDARTVDLFQPSLYSVESGALTGELLERYLMIAGSGAVELLQLDPFNNSYIGDWITLASPSGVESSGIVNHVESNNLTLNPFLFFTISGEGFFQRNPEESFWRNYTSGTPTSDITIIRVDDAL